MICLKGMHKNCSESMLICLRYKNSSKVVENPVNNMRTSFWYFFYSNLFLFGVLISFSNEHGFILQEYKNKHPSFSYLPDGANNATVASNAPSNVVTSSVISTSTVSNTLASQQQQKIITSIVGTMNRPSVTTVVGQNQVIKYVHIVRMI